MDVFHAMIPHPESFPCQNADAGLKQLATGKNVDAGLPFLCHSSIYLWFFNIIVYSKNNTSSSILLTSTLS
jgi:hypothetical protein